MSASIQTYALRTLGEDKEFSIVEALPLNVDTVGQILSWTRGEILDDHILIPTIGEPARVYYEEGVVTRSLLSYKFRVVSNNKFIEDYVPFFIPHPRHGVVKPRLAHKGAARAKMAGYKMDGIMNLFDYILWEVSDEFNNTRQVADFANGHIESDEKILIPSLKGTLKAKPGNYICVNKNTRDVKVVSPKQFQRFFTAGTTDPSGVIQELGGWGWDIPS